MIGIGRLAVLARRNVTRAERIAMIQVRLQRRLRDLQGLAFVADRHLLVFVLIRRACADI